MLDPRIKELNSKTGRVFHVARRERETVHQRRCSDQAVRRRYSYSFSFGLNRNLAPPVSDGLGHGQQIGLKPLRYALLEQLVQRRAAFAKVHGAPRIVFLPLQLQT